MKSVAKQNKPSVATTNAPAVSAAPGGRGNAWAQERLTADRASEEEDHGHDHEHDHEEDQSRERPARGGGRGPSEATLDAERPVGAAIPTDLRARLMAELTSAAESNSVLEAIREKQGNLDFPIVWSRRGGYQLRDKINLDRREPESAWLSTLAHEIVHLKAHFYGEQGNTATQGREAYIQTQMDEEIEGSASSYVTLLQLGITQNSAGGFNEFVDWLAVEHPELARSALDPDEELANQAEIKEVARPWLEDHYRNEWRGSQSGLNYYDKWGDHWDAEHAATP
ncbi:MAG: hypothetical protein Q8P18_17135 [Pseudomonadota bacterium]|nr:hypothetical protein [Pseudomonadota bacterium]